MSTTQDFTSMSNEDIANDLTLSKSHRSRILVLNRGLSQYRTSKLIGISPQFVSNVVNREKDRLSRQTR